MGMTKADAGRLGGSNPAGPAKRTGAGNGRWMGDVQCTACAAPAVYKTARLCKRCRDRVRNLGYAVGPPDPIRQWWVRLGRPTTCVVPACNRPHDGLGLCGTHKSRYYRNGHPLWGARGWNRVLDPGDAFTGVDVADPALAARSTIFRVPLAPRC